MGNWFYDSFVVGTNSINPVVQIIPWTNAIGAYTNLSANISTL